MNNWSSINKEDFWDKVSDLPEKETTIKWSADKKKCTYEYKGVDYLMMKYFYKSKSFYINKNAYNGEQNG